jgi:hypothetical protein
MRQPFSKLNILWLCGQRQKVALDRAFCIFLVEELLWLIVKVDTLGAECGGYGGRVCQRWHGRKSGRGWRGCTAIETGFEVLCAFGVAPTETLATEGRHDD